MSNASENKAGIAASKESDIHLIIGGARSGKSRLAESHAQAFEQQYANAKVSYVATAQALDNEMSNRISKHQSQRPNHWQLVEAPKNLAQSLLALIDSNDQPHCILVDCLTLWLSNALCDGNGETWSSEKEQLLTFIDSFQRSVLKSATGENQKVKQPVKIILVSNEVGHGIVPMGELSRHFVDQAGWLHQALAEKADRVDFVMAGIPMALKSSSAKNSVKEIK